MQPETAGRADLAFVGLGQMGQPMTRRLIEAGFAVRGCDLSEPARAAFAAQGGQPFARVAEAAAGQSILITMLPHAGIVRGVALEAAEALAPGALLIDMSSSAPLATRALGDELAARGLSLIDAPVSGGVRRAVSGTLAIMAGGAAEDVERARPALAAMGSTVFHTGALGTGHAAKALNNYVSAAGLSAACEAMIVARRFGLDPATLTDVLNASTGRNNSTEVKLKPFILSGSFAAGFTMALMAKDVRTAADLADALGGALPGLGWTAELWERAAAALGGGADHTEIFRYLDTDA